LAGRNKQGIKLLAEKFNLSFRIFDLDDTETLVAALKDVKLVIHAAGPFQYTAKQMIEACLQTGTHYLDINGDIAVFEMIKRYDDAAKKAGIMLMPGAGFDVVPTDCISMQLKNKLPDAISLQLAFATLGGGISHGTAMTMAGKIGEGGAVRKNGNIIRNPLGQKGMWVDFGKQKLFVMSIPWGDISTAYFSTVIRNIETFTGISQKAYYFLKAQFLFNWLLRTKFVRGIIKNKISQRPAGPSDAQRNKAISLVWGKVVNEKNETVSISISGPEGYTLTAHSALIIANKVLNGNYSIGYQTPASAYGENLVFEIPGVKREMVVE
jgi:short subunit dehydrogenase-like uncharacterized protein